MHEYCEKTGQWNVPIEYYEDEELDIFRGRGADSYSAEEIEQFREVLYTMRPDEVAGWLVSLQRREVELPDEIKDETVMLINDAALSEMEGEVQ